MIESPNPTQTMSLQIRNGIGDSQSKKRNNQNTPVPTNRRKSDTRPSNCNYLTRGHPSQMSNMR
jgi:hypothetical protein